MNVEINISITINGQQENVPYEDAKKLYNELGKIFKEKQPSPYVPSLGGIARKEPFATLGDSLISDKNENPSYGGIKLTADESVQPGFMRATGVEDVVSKIPDMPDTSESCKILKSAQESLDAINNRVTDMDEVMKNMSKLTATP